MDVDSERGENWGLGGNGCWGCWGCEECRGTAFGSSAGSGPADVGADNGLRGRESGEMGRDGVWNGMIYAIGERSILRA